MAARSERVKRHRQPLCSALGSSQVLTTVILVLGAVMLDTAPLRAQGLIQPYDNFTLDHTGRPVPIPAPYVLERIIDGVALGIGDFASPGDVFSDRASGHLYIVDTGNNRIVELAPDWSVVRQFGPELGLDAPQGIYRDPVDGTFWIADTGNVRILHVGDDGRFLQAFEPPQSDVLASVRTAGPTKVLRDRRGYIYFLEGSGAGMIVMDLQNQFRGFFGTNHLGFSLRWLWARYLTTEEQRHKLLLSRPTAHTDMYLAADGYVYTSAAGEERDQIQKLSPVGVNIFVEKGLERKLYQNKRFGERRRAWDPPFLYVSLTVSDDGIVTALEQTTGRLYQFDQDRNLLMAFGKRGSGPVAFGLPNQVEMDSRGFLYVADSSRSVIHVLRPTHFTQLVHQASAQQFDGQYDRAADTWQAVLHLASNYQRAHSGIGKARYQQQQWQAAMDRYTLARDQLGYSQAFVEYRQDLLRQYISWIISGTFLVLLGILVWPAFAQRQRRAPATASGQERVLPAVLGILVRPVDTLERIAQGRSLWPILALLMAAGLARVVSLALIAFHMRATPVVGSMLDWLRLYRPVAASLLPELRWEDAKIYLEFLRIAIPWGLWTVANFGVATLFDGEGTARGVARTTAFCLVPYIVLAVPIALLSHVLMAGERGLYETLWSLTYYWVLLLLILQLRTVHHYTWRQTLRVGTVIIFGVVVLSGATVMFGILGAEALKAVGDVVYDIIRLL
jgi:hypothetical protein